MTREKASSSAGTPETDIIFECPHCEKSLSIDRRGAGLMIACPGCDEQIQVPLSEDSEASENEQESAEKEAVAAPPGDLNEALKASREKVTRLTEALEEFRQRRSFLEQLRADNLVRFEKIGDEIAVIQSALDRMVGLLQDAVSESTPPPPKKRT